MISPDGAKRFVLPILAALAVAGCKTTAPDYPGDDVSLDKAPALPTRIPDKPYIHPEELSPSQFPETQQRLVLEIKATDALLGSFLDKSDIIDKQKGKMISASFDRITDELDKLSYRSEMSLAMRAKFLEFNRALADKKVDDTEFVKILISVRSQLGWLAGELRERNSKSLSMT